MRITVGKRIEWTTGGMVVSGFDKKQQPILKWTDVKNHTGVVTKTFRGESIIEVKNDETKKLEELHKAQISQVL